MNGRFAVSVETDDQGKRVATFGSGRREGLSDRAMVLCSIVPARSATPVFEPDGAPRGARRGPNGPERRRGLGFDPVTSDGARRQLRFTPASDAPGAEDAMAEPTPFRKALDAGVREEGEAKPPFNPTTPVAELAPEEAMRLLALHDFAAVDCSAIVTLLWHAARYFRSATAEERDEFFVWWYDRQTELVPNIGKLPKNDREGGGSYGLLTAAVQALQDDCVALEQRAQSESSESDAESDGEDEDEERAVDEADEAPEVEEEPARVVKQPRVRFSKFSSKLYPACFSRLEPEDAEGVEDAQESWKKAVAAANKKRMDGTSQAKARLDPDSLKPYMAEAASILDIHGFGPECRDELDPEGEMLARIASKLIDPAIWAELDQRMKGTYSVQAFRKAWDVEVLAPREKSDLLKDIFHTAQSVGYKPGNRRVGEFFMEFKKRFDRLSTRVDWPRGKAGRALELDRKILIFIYVALPLEVRTKVIDSNPEVFSKDLLPSTLVLAEEMVRKADLAIGETADAAKAAAGAGGKPGAGKPASKGASGQGSAGASGSGAGFKRSWAQATAGAKPGAGKGDHKKPAGGGQGGRPQEGGDKPRKDRKDKKDQKKKFFNKDRK